MTMKHATEHSGRYDDIIHLPHHVSASHPQMPLSERAAQFSPFAALSGYHDAIAEAARFTDEKRELDENMKAVLDEKLHMLLHRQERPRASITYFLADTKKSGGSYVNAAGIIEKIDLRKREICMEDGTIIAFDDISAIEEIT